ncbi:hypothetical protein IscW_ISCW008533 [Ixodes scapularis]|uniref:Uncharacterized protein n=1 Tax=Ixodes scapularis TaxID=6945 RepID=B7Q3K4_IXOSC|nr:hypothetical protein IscW_ISCW008533 [Ixodes scapularis]|eukprot:XP_002411302.1 hypothetical protein IscW_ISCW008533 [Ixodes scapularis]
MSMQSAPRGKKPPSKSAKSTSRFTRRTKVANWSEESDTEQAKENVFEPPRSVRKALPRRKCKIQLQLSDSESEGEKAS